MAALRAVSCLGTAMWTPTDRALVGDFGSGQALTDDQFRPLEPLIPPAKPGGRPRTTDIDVASDTSRRDEPDATVAIWRSGMGGRTTTRGADRPDLRWLVVAPTSWLSPLQHVLRPARPRVKPAVPGPVSHGIRNSI